MLRKNNNNFKSCNYNILTHRILLHKMYIFLKLPTLQFCRFQLCLLYRKYSAGNDNNKCLKKYIYIIFGIFTNKLFKKLQVYSRSAIKICW